MIETPVRGAVRRRVERDVAQLGPREDRVRAIIFIKRLEDYHLFAGINDGQHRGDHRLGRAAGDDNLAVGIDVQSQMPFRLRGDRFPKTLGAPGDRVLIDVGVDGFAGRAFDVFRGREVGEALREIDRAVSERLAAHVADDGFGEAGSFAGDAIFHNRLIRVTTLLPAPRLIVRLTNCSTSGRSSHRELSCSITRSAPCEAASSSVTAGTSNSREAALKLIKSLLSYT